jgi:pyrroline-5-carboxylate reductase
MTDFATGTLGIAILSGIFSSLSENSYLPSPAGPDSGTVTPTSDGPPPSTPSKFIACVRRPESAKRIKRALQEYSQDLQILQNENVKGVRAADVVILGCKPQMVKDVLAGVEMRAALKNKLLISICAGVPVSQIEEILYGGQESSADSHQPANRCRIVRAMPNTAAVVRQSMTVIATSDPPLPAEIDSLVTWIFSRIGRVVHLPPATMDASTALCGSGPAFIALMLQSLADGGVAMGLPRAEAQVMAAQAMRGTADMVLRGEHPAMVSEKVSTPGGCTIGGLLVLEEGRVRGTIARSVREATVVAGQLGKGVTGVNGPRLRMSDTD